MAHETEAPPPDNSRMHPAEGTHHPYGFKPPLEMLKRMALMRRRLKRRQPLKDNLAPLPRE